ncbi:MAG: flagellar motor switch protein FliN [Gammaproteobacteria bacterium]|nr:flagellar motor switch protein FliN [Gammaproteobacteria bacterium]
MSDSNLASNLPESAQGSVADIQGRAESLGDEFANQNMDLVMEIPVTLSMELGRTRISIQDLLQLNSGSVVELQRMADEPMDVLVNGTLVAHGEAVVIGDKFGVRLTDVVSAKERVKRIR